MEMLLHSTKRDFSAVCVVLTLLPLYYKIDMFKHAFQAHSVLEMRIQGFLSKVSDTCPLFPLCGFLARLRASTPIRTS